MIHVILYQDDTIGLRPDDTQKEVRISLEDVYALVVRAECGAKPGECTPECKSLSS